MCESEIFHNCIKMVRTFILLLILNALLMKVNANNDTNNLRQNSENIKFKIYDR